MVKAVRNVKAGKIRPISMLVNWVVWFTGILVSLAVGFGMTDGILVIRWIPGAITIIAGWVVVILTMLGVILAIVERM